MRLLLPRMSIALLCACGSVANDGDNVAPTVTNITPASPSTVTEDFSIVISFSEPMDTASVESAIVLLPTTVPTLSWSADEDELTITPGIRYAEGTDPAAVSLQQVAVALGTTAADVAGNHLAAATTLDYTLKFKRITAVFPFSQTVSGNCSPACTTTFNFFQAGEGATDPTLTTRGFLTIPFDLPDGITIERAVLNSQIELINNDPFGKLGDLSIEHLRFAAINSTSFAAPGTNLGALIPASPAPVLGALIAFDVTGAFSEDYVNRVVVMNQTQYRIRFPHDTTDDPNYTTYHGDGVSDLARLLRTATNVTATYRIE